MSALPLKADMLNIGADVCFVPQADIAYWLFSAETRQLASLSPLPDLPNSLQNSLRCAPHPTLGNYGTNDPPRRGHSGPVALSTTAVCCRRLPSHAMSQKPSPPTPPAAGEGRYLTFTLGNESMDFPFSMFGRLSASVRSPAPRMPAHVKGVINLRGTVIAVLDLRAKFQLAAKDYGERSCIIVAQVPAPSSGNTLMGAIVDAVEEVVQLTAEDIEGTRTSEGRRRRNTFWDWLLSRVASKSYSTSKKSSRDGTLSLPPLTKPEPTQPEKG